MIRGVIEKVRSLERDGALNKRGSESIRYALAAAIVKAELAKWSERAKEPGVEVGG
jgi:hypothetical protein